MLKHGESDIEQAGSSARGENVSDNSAIDNSAIVVDFVNAWNAMDLDQIMSYLAPDCFYHNIPMEPAVGTEAILAVLKGFIDMSKQVDFTVHNISESSEGVVLTERTDRFLIGENWVAIPVMGAFELSDGKISAWRDYFDMGQFQNQMAGG
jgi:limonene-1,2-epoxide hydrolase